MLPQRPHRGDGDTVSKRRGGGQTADVVVKDHHRHRLWLMGLLAHRWRWLSDGQYAHVGGMVGEIGRLLGGWLKSATA